MPSAGRGFASSSSPSTAIYRTLLIDAAHHRCQRQRWHCRRPRQRRRRRRTPVLPWPPPRCRRPSGRRGWQRRRRCSCPPSSVGERCRRRRRRPRPRLPTRGHRCATGANGPPECPRSRVARWRLCGGRRGPLSPLAASPPPPPRRAVAGAVSALRPRRLLRLRLRRLSRGAPRPVTARGGCVLWRSRRGRLPTPAARRCGAR